MITTDYENTYASVAKACRHTADLEKVIEVLSKASKAMTCRDIGLAIWGADYLDNRRYSAHMGQMLKHLRQGKFIRWVEINGEPVEVEYDEYQRDVDDEGNTYYITVRDDEGNKYQMHNPKWRGGYSGGRWVKVKKTVIPRIKVYSLVR